jgi:hypothetical protein
MSSQRLGDQLYLSISSCPTNYTGSCTVARITTLTMSLHNVLQAVPLFGFPVNLGTVHGSVHFAVHGAQDSVGRTPLFRT